jgi:hypothetical protein
MALGAYLAAATARSLTIPALILKRSSRDMPGFLGTPAGITTEFRKITSIFYTSLSMVSSLPISASLMASSSCVGPTWPVTVLIVSM